MRGFRPLRAQALVVVAVMIPGLLAVAGLAIDAGLVFDARRELYNVADAAARAGAMQLDEQVYRDSDGATVLLDEGKATDIATQYLEEYGGGAAEFDYSVAASAAQRRVTVVATGEVEPAFLSLLGISTVDISAEASATQRFGIEDG